MFLGEYHRRVFRLSPVDEVCLCRSNSVIIPKGTRGRRLPLLSSTHSSFRRRTMSPLVFEALMAGAKEVWWNEYSVK
jgi:hypothetical protein